jgi:hypothetical protein
MYIHGTTGANFSPAAASVHPAYMPEAGSALHERISSQTEIGQAWTSCQDYAAVTPLSTRDRDEEGLRLQRGWGRVIYGVSWKVAGGSGEVGRVAEALAVALCDFGVADAVEALLVEVPAKCYGMALK